MRRRRLVLPLLVIAIAAVIYATQGDEAAAPRPVQKPPYVDLRAPGMEMRAVPPPIGPSGPESPTSDTPSLAPPAGR